MSDIPLDEVVYFDAITSSPTTGAATDADSTPTFDVYEEATDTGLLGATNLTKRTSLTGNYRGTFTASAANGFEVGKWYSVIVSATVGGIAAKACVANFRIGPAEAQAGYNKVDVQYAAGTAWTSGAITAAVFAADAITAAKVAADVGAEIADAVWDELTSGHVTSGSFGQALATLRANTAASGAAGSITLDASASAVNDFYNGAQILITGGAGAGQSRIIQDYDGTSKAATIAPNWATTPDNTSVFVILPAAVGGYAELIWALVDGIETGFTPRRVMRIIAASVAGQSSGGPGSPVYRDLTNSRDQYSVTATSAGDRSSPSYGA